LKSKKIYLVRHGQTDFNKQGIVQGMGINSSLNKTGKMQADAFYARYRTVQFDKIYISGLKRTEESVRKFINLGIPTRELFGLNEISWGIQEGMPVSEERDKYYNSVLNAWKEGKTDIKIEGGESPEDVSERLSEALDIILSQNDEKTILIAHHGRAIRILLCKLLNYPLRYMDIFDHSNLGLYLINYTGKMFAIERFNDTSHLDILDSL